MPFPGEHSCRMMDPGKCDRVRRENDWRRDKGRRIDAIWCITKGKTELQAMRYPVEDWKEADARQH